MESGSAATPLLAWSGAQLAQVGVAIDRVVAAWQAAWLPQGADAQRAACVPAHEQGDARHASWTAVGQEGDARMWLRAGAAATRLALELFGGDTPLAHAVAVRAQAALQNELARALGLHVAPVADSLPVGPFDRWSGAVVVGRDGLPSFDLLLDAGCVRRLVTREAPALPPRKPLADALADRKLALRVELAPVELSLGALAGLRIGDVITIPHAIDDPLQVTACGASVCEGWLGRRHGHRAVELAGPHQQNTYLPSKAA